MKKYIGPPENWQDFESLCKKLFGEVWGCPHTIKKNGRLGQPQSGVDVYGKPKGASEYFGIQCKGKDNYESKQLTQKEIDEEIAKALLFKPKLKTFVFATTAPKDVYIEEYIRIKDQESVSNGNFDIVLYSWPDLSDLIEEYRDTFNWYMNNIQFKDQFDVLVSFEGGLLEKAVSPKFLKTITTYELVDKETLEHYERSRRLIPHWKTMSYTPLFGAKEINHGWCSFELEIKNTGSKVVEDWKLNLSFPDTVNKIADDFKHSLFNYKELAPYRTTWADQEDKTILYKPLNNRPLIQKDSRSFKSSFLPHLNSEKEMIIKWELLARDFNQQGQLKVTMEPEYELSRQREPVILEKEVKTEERISYYITQPL